MAANFATIRRSRVWLAAVLAVLSALTVAIFAADPAGASTSTRTFYQYTSEPGDYIGGGGADRYTRANSTISVGGTSGFLTLSVKTDTEWWYVDLAAPRGENLRPGMYYDAERATFRTGRSPGLDVSGNGRGCNEVWGSFAINQISTDESGKVTMLDASFTQRCGYSTAPTLEGRVMFNAKPLSYAFSSDPGDYIGGGLSKTYLGATSDFSLGGTDQSMQYVVTGMRDDWTAVIRAPSGQRLHPGTYRTARFADADHAGLDVSGNGRGCNQSTGTLTITGINLNERGRVTGLGATFEQHCEGAAAALHGTIRYRVPVDTRKWEYAAQSTLRNAATAASACAADNDGSYVNCATVAQIQPYGFTPTTGVAVNGMNGNATDWSAAMQHSSGGRAFTFATFGDSAGQAVAAPRGTGAPALPDRSEPPDMTEEWEAAARSDLESAATAAASCSADNGGSYINCATISQLRSYGFHQSQDVTYTNVVATVTRWAASTQNINGGATFGYDTAGEGRVVVGAPSP